MRSGRILGLGGMGLGSIAQSTPRGLVHIEPPMAGDETTWPMRGSNMAASPMASLVNTINVRPALDDDIPNGPPPPPPAPGVVPVSGSRISGPPGADTPDAPALPAAVPRVVS